MKLTPHQKSFVYELLALGTRPCIIVEKVNKRFDPKGNSFQSNHLAFYQKRWRGLSKEQQRQHLPYTMEDSFAVQDVRINDDIKQMQRINGLLEKAEDAKPVDTEEIVNLINMGIRIKNRIAQELGQARAFTKGGVGNINLLQMQLNQFNTLVSKGSKMDPTEQLKYLNTIYKVIDSGDKSSQEKDNVIDDAPERDK